MLIENLSLLKSEHYIKKCHLLYAAFIFIVYTESQPLQLEQFQIFIMEKNETLFYPAK